MDNAKSHYLRQSAYPLDERIHAWLRGPDPVDEQVARHLEALTGVPAHWWVQMDRDFVERGGVIQPAAPIYHVDQLMEWEATCTLATFFDATDAERHLTRFKAEAEGNGEDDRATHVLRRDVLWLPRARAEREATNKVARPSIAA